MDNWYKKAQREPRRSIKVDDSGAIMKGIDMSVFDESKLQQAKRWLEEKHPDMNWTLDAVAEWVNKYFIGKQKPISEQGYKDQVHKL